MRAVAWLFSSSSVEDPVSEPIGTVCVTPSTVKVTDWPVEVCAGCMCSRNAATCGRLPATD